jgi:hypothetical protein
MIKKLHFKTLLLLCAMIMGIGSAWATDVTFAYADYKEEGTQSTGSAYTMVKKDVSITNTKFYGNNSYAHFYANGVTTITPGTGITITQVVITASSTSYNGFQSSGEVTPSIGSVSSDNTTVTWTGSATDAFTISNNKQIRWTSIVVTYSTSGGGDTPTTYTVTYNGNGATSGVVPVDNKAYSATNNVVTVLGNTGNLAKEHNTFNGWNTVAAGTGTGYVAGNTFTISANTTLYAQWTVNTNTVTLPAADQYGTYAMSATNPVAFGTEVTLTYTPAAGYESYQATWSVNGEEISGNKFTMPDEAVAVTVSLQKVLAMSIDFESDATTYSDWTFTNIVSNYKNSGVDTHGGSKYGSTDGKASGSIQTKEKVSPVSLTCYVSKQTTNSTESTWYVQVSSDGTTWTNAGSKSATDMVKGEWKEFTVDLSKYSDVYVRVYYNGSTAVRLIDDLRLVLQDSDKPSISANNVVIAFDATSGAITYTLDNEPTPVGTLTASVPDGCWLTLGTVGTTIPFTCGANNTNAERTATVTLTYTYGSESVTKDVTITQAANPNAVDNISDITAAGDYTVKGTIVAKSQRGFIVGDGTGYVYYYNQNYTQTDYNIGDKVKLSGAVVAYGGVFEFNNTTTVTAATESNYQAENPTVLSGSDMDTRVASTTPAQLSNYVQYQGTLTVNGTHYNITNIEGAETAIGSISYPISTDFASLNGKTVKVSGYYVGISSSTYYNTIIGSVEEVASTAPVINVDPATVNLAANATSGEFGYSITNPVTGTGLTAACQADWISNITVGNDKVTFEASANEGAAREATITLTYINVTKSVTVKQAAPVQPASLPFAFDGGIADVKPENGMTQEGLGSDYNNSPKLKFDGTGDYLILSFNDRPGKLTFDIKGNGFSGGTFTVQTSEDGVTYTDLETYTELGATQTEEFNNLGEDVRYIKWIYTEKVDGNVALGNISLAKYKELQKYTLTVSGLENVSLFVFDAAAQNDPLIPNGGNGSAQVLEGTQVLISPAPAEGYELQSLLVDGVDHKADLEPNGSYTFTMPEKNITITATVSEVIPVETTTYTLATTITSGKHYIITDGVDKAMGGQNTNNRAAVDATIREGKASVASDAGVCEVVIYGPYTVGENQCYTIYDEAKGYLYAASSSSNYLRTEELLDANGNGQWTIEIDDEGIATIKAQGENSRNWMRFNGSGNGLFACYASDSKQSDIYLFEKDGDNGTVTTTVEIAEACTDGEKYYGTYSNENAFVVPSDVTVAEIGIKDGALNVKEYVTGSLVPANTGVMISSATPGDKSLTLATGGASLMGEGNALRPSGPNGITAERMAETGDYLYYRLTMHKGTQIGFWWGAAGGAAFKLEANKAYLVVPVNEAREGFAFGDETTGISHMLMNGEQTTRIYDLQGRSVAQPTKGLYIVNGKKVVVK